MYTHPYLPKPFTPHPDTFKLGTDPNLYCYVGATQQGKSTLAFGEVLSVSQTWRRPLLIIHRETVETFNHVPRRAPTMASALQWVYAGGVTRWAPKSLDELEQMAAALSRGKNCVVLLDEFPTLIEEYGGNIPPKIKFLLREWAHVKCSIHVTAHSLTKDIGSLFLGLSPKIRLFKTTAPPGLRLLAAVYGVNTKELQTYNVGEFRVLDL